MLQHYKSDGRSPGHYQTASTRCRILECTSMLPPGPYFLTHMNKTEDKELIISFCQCLFRQIDGNNEDNEHIKEEYNSSIVD